jgi:GT2 family glycosyltransferase
VKVGFVCTNYNNTLDTKAAVASLRDGGRWADVRVVVVDNRSEESEVAELRELARELPQVEVIFSPTNVGYFAGLNLGIRQIRTRYPEIQHLVVGNNDLLFPDGFVESLQNYCEVFERWAVVSPDLVTLEGIHQNPHVLFPISGVRRLVWDLYFASYPAAILVRQLATVTKRFTSREESQAGSDLSKTAGPIAQGYGACYLIGPAFFRHFSRLYAPTFMMQEEFFLGEQLKGIGQQTYYDPRFIVHHRGHATTDKVPSRRLWVIARAAHLTYKQYLALSPEDRLAMVTNGTREPT